MRPHGNISVILGLYAFATSYVELYWFLGGPDKMVSYELFETFLLFLVVLFSQSKMRRLAKRRDIPIFVEWRSVLNDGETKRTNLN